MLRIIINVTNLTQKSYYCCVISLFNVLAIPPPRFNQKGCGCGGEELAWRKQRRCEHEDVSVVRAKMWAWCTQRGFVFPPKQKRPTKQRRRPPTLFLCLGLNWERQRHKSRQRKIDYLLFLCLGLKLERQRHKSRQRKREYIRGNSDCRTDTHNQNLRCYKFFPSFFPCLQRHKSRQRKREFPSFLLCLRRHKSRQRKR